MAQLVEQLIRNQQVAGSNPASSSKSQRTDKSLSSGFLSYLSVARNGAVRTLTRKRHVLPGAPYGVWQYTAKTQPFCTLKTNREDRHQSAARLFKLLVGRSKRCGSDFDA